MGKPMNTVSTRAYFPLSGFHAGAPALRNDFRPEVLFIGTLDPHDEYSAIERWPVLKALEQFGSFSGDTTSSRRPAIRKIERSAR